MKKIFLLLIPFILLTGCSTMEALDNRVSCTMNKQEAYVNSMYGPIGITSKISQKDSQAICKKPE